MKLKAANIIAVELGILIGLMSCLVYSRFPSAGPRIAAANLQENTADPIAPVESDAEPEKKRASTTDYFTEQQKAQLLAEQQAFIRYQQEIAPRPYANSRVANGYAAVNPPPDAELDQETAIVSSEDISSPRTVAYVQPTETVVYSQPVQTIVYSQPLQTVVFSNARRFVDRRRSKPHQGAVPPIADRCHDNREPRGNGSKEFEGSASPSATLRHPANSFGIVHRADTGAHTRRPAQASRPRDHH